VRFTNGRLQSTPPPALQRAHRNPCVGCRLLGGSWSSSCAACQVNTFHPGMAVGYDVHANPCCPFRKGRVRDDRSLGRGTNPYRDRNLSSLFLLLLLRRRLLRGMSHVHRSDDDPCIRQELGREGGP
jgi:hypothetical protein